MIEMKGKKNNNENQSLTRTLPPNYRLKAKRKESEQKNPETMSKRNSRGGSIRKKMSFSNVDKRMSLRQRKTELSTEDSAPGVLKIFGHSVSPGSDYKSVLATTRSTAIELVKESLERYSISRDRADEYVLCDVIGRIVNYESESDLEESGFNGRGYWQEECVRVVGENERPLILQSFWKPDNGYSRRFELRKRSEMLEDSEKDTTTCGINANARRLLITKTDKGAIPRVQALGVEIQHQSTRPQLNLTKNLHVSGESARLTLPPEDKPLWYKFTESEENCKSSSKEVLLNPCLLVISGHDPDRDKIYYELTREITIIGSDSACLREEDIILSAPDVENKHCYIHKAKINDEFVKSASIWSVTLDPFPGCEVKVNKEEITRKKQIIPGDIITVGEHYIMLLKDPQCANQRSIADILKSMTCVLPSCFPSEDLQLGESATSSPSPSTEANHVGHNTHKEYRNSKYIKVPFITSDEDKVIERVIALSEESEPAYPLAPSFLLCGVIEFLSYKESPDHLLKMLDKIAVAIQNRVWVGY